MATLTVPDVSEEVVRALEERAKENHRSMAQELSALLEEKARPPDAREKRLAALERIEEGRKHLKRPVTAEEVDEWIRTGRP